MAQQPFRVERTWPGQTVVVIGGGPSLTLAQVRHIAIARLEGRCRVIAVNDAAFVAWWADWLHACDEKWWMWHAQRAPQFPGRKTTLAETLPPQSGVDWLRNTGNEGFDPDPTCCRTGSSGVYQAMHCSIHAGARRILLVGVDMKDDGDRSHWFGDHPEPSPCDRAEVMVPKFPTLRSALEAGGIDVINCSPGSALKEYLQGVLEQSL